MVLLGLLGPPTLGPPTLGPPTLGPPTLGPPTLGPPTLTLPPPVHPGLEPECPPATVLTQILDTSPTPNMADLILLSAVLFLASEHQ